MPDEPIPPSTPPVQRLDPAELLARGIGTVKPSEGTSPWVPPEPEELARMLPQYQITRLLGHGGMGAVYHGVQVSLERAVAVKLLPAEVAVDSQFVARFQREAKVLARLQHPGIVTVYDFGQTSEGHLYFVMEFVDGTDLQKVIATSKTDPGARLKAEQALELITQICDALHYAHRMGVIHRDIKPANILIGKDGRAKVADFGLARPVNDEDASVITSVKVVMGTPAYMAPEQHLGEADQRSDIFALGVMFYEMLTGHRPRGPQAPSHKVQIDVRIDEVVLKALQHAPEQRYQQAGDMKQAVEKIRTTPPPAQVRPSAAAPPPKRNISASVAAAIAVLLLALAGYFFYLKSARRVAENVATDSAQKAPLADKGEPKSPTTAGANSTPTARPPNQSEQRSPSTPVASSLPQTPPAASKSEPRVPAAPMASSPPTPPPAEKSEPRAPASTIASSTQTLPPADEPEQSIFNGTDLTGWSGQLQFWSVKDGAITGRVTPQTAPDSNTFLVWQGGDVSDFEFSCRFKLAADNPSAWANSGIDFRARVTSPTKFDLKGYQAELDAGTLQPKGWPPMANTTGCLIDDPPGILLCPVGQKVIARSGFALGSKILAPTTALGSLDQKAPAAYRKNDWNDFRIVAVGNHILIYLNGYPAADVTDEGNRFQSGRLGLQLHRNDSATLQFKDLKLKKLRAGAAIASPTRPSAQAATPTPSPTPAPSSATIAPGATATLLADTVVATPFGSSTIPKGTQLPVLGKEGADYKLRFATNAVTVRASNVQLNSPTSTASSASTPAPATPLPVATATPVASKPSYRLLEGENVSGWKQVGKGGMKIRNGVGTTWFPENQGYYGVAWFEKRMFSDFVLTAEYRGVQAVYNSGIRLRFPVPTADPSSVSKEGYEISILDTSNPLHGKEANMDTGSIAHIQVPKTKAPLRPAGAWNEIEVTVVRQQYTVKINGVVVNEFVGSKRLVGFVGIENHNGGPVEFRNLTVRELN